MSFENLYLERCLSDKNYDELDFEGVILNGKELTPELREAGFNKGTADAYWRITPVAGIALQVTADEGKLRYQLVIYHTSGVPKKYGAFMADWAAKNKVKSDKPEDFWEAYINSKLEYQGYDYEDKLLLSVSTVMKCMTYYTSDSETFTQICYELSMFLRELPSTEEKTAFDSAMENSADTNRYARSLKAANWKEAEKLFEKWGLTTDTAPLMAKLCTMPAGYSTAELKAIINKYGKEVSKDGSLKRALFTQLQKKAADYYYEKGGKPSKELIEEIAKMLAAAFETFGYGVHPNGLVAVIRAFHNDAIEGIGLEMYQNNTVYNANDFGYSDGNAQEKKLSKFWEGINIVELIK